MEIRGVRIDWLGHDGFLIVDQNGKRIAIDPFNVSDTIKPVDIILITHSHQDHCSLKDIEKLSRDGTSVVHPVDCHSKLNKIQNIQFDVNISTVGIKLKVKKIDIYPFPAYNINKEFHPKEEGWMGYMLKLGDVIIYHAGDTDKIPEMDGLQYIAQEGEEVVALLPISGKYVMTAEEAAEVAAVIKPSIAIPMHYGSGVAGTKEDAEIFVKLCKEKGINGVLLDKI
jgi:L-ascorbate metabolism protein UlaG (beta-lactamase superfamily)